jgi:8-oxo-dGTP pyrophosphatase MutT (NUDIX family)
MIKDYKDYIKEVGKGAYAAFSGNGVEDEPHKFWGNIGGGVLPICLKTKRILLPLRSEFVNEPNTWGIWGGKLDEDEVQTDIQDVVRREFKEETDYDCNCFELVPAYIFETPNKSFKYYNFIGLFENEFTPKLNWETKKFKWVTFDELIKIEPKHFGLKGLLEHDLEKIKNFVK